MRLEGLLVMLLAGACAGEGSSADAGGSDDGGVTGAATTDGGSTSSVVTGSDEGTTKGADEASGSSGPPEEPPTMFGGDRPVELHVPDDYDPGTPAPLLFVLHGYAGNGSGTAQYFGIGPAANDNGFLWLAPDGVVDTDGNAFWNATDACCDRYDTGVDDVAYLSGLIEDIGAYYSVDPQRIYFLGHSAGSFMAYRMACEHPELTAAIVGVAGATFKNPEDCLGSDPVHVLHIHGSDDDVVPYGGGLNWGVAFPGAVETTTVWAEHDGCGDPTPDVPPIDVDVALPGDETTVTRYEDGCAPGGSVELWRIEGGSHSPSLGASFPPSVIDYCLGHPKP